MKNMVLCGTMETRTLARGLLLLRVLSQGDRRLGELAREVQLSPSTVYRLLNTLRCLGFVEEEEGRWRIGLEAYRVGLAYAERPWIQRVLPLLKRLVEELGETVNLAVLDGTEAVYVAQESGGELLRTFTRLGAHAPLHCTGVGKVLLAFQPDPEALFRLPLVAYTPKTLKDPQALMEELEAVRRHGFAVDNEERELGVRCVAVPFRHQGQVVAAISLSAPAARLAGERIAEVAAALKAAASSLAG